MNNLETKELVDNLFGEIRNVKNVNDLLLLAERFSIPKKNFMDNTTYPRINFGISSSELEEMIIHGYLTDDLLFAKDITSNIKDPLTKLLYAMAWKNGDLKKIKHIAKGIMSSKDDFENQDHALVFYQFGKFLTKKSGEPIIDQHVLRAFGIYETSNELEIHKLRCIDAINKNHKDLIRNYIYWLNSDFLSMELRNTDNYSYQIDMLLFALGKTIKLAKKDRNKM